MISFYPSQTERLAMLLNIRHETSCRYDQPVSRSIQQLRLTPRAESGQHAISWRISAPGHRRQLTDAYGNVSHLLTLDQLHREINIVVEDWSRRWTRVPICCTSVILCLLLTYLGETPLTHADEAIRSLSRQCLNNGHDRFRLLMDFLPTVRECVAYDASAPETELTAAQALAAGKGGEHDHAHVFISACRAAGIPARFVSGYYYAGEPDAAGQGAGHAWADAWVDDLGWVSFDVTRARLTGREHCRLAVGRDYLDACPVRAVRRGGFTQELRISVQAETAPQ